MRDQDFDIRYNKEGYPDPTAYNVLRKEKGEGRGAL